MEEELKAAFSGADVKLISGHGGVFEVTCDEKLIYTKSATGRFPDEGEISDIIKSGTD